MCSTWLKSLQSVAAPNADTLPDWGPSAEELLAAAVKDVTASSGRHHGEDDEEECLSSDDGEDFELEVADEDDEGLYETIEAFARADLRDSDAL